MAGGKSPFLEAQFLNWVLGKTNTWSPPDTVYFALSTALYSETATGGSLSEVTGGSYARVAVANTATNFPAASRASGSTQTIKSNGTTIAFPTPSGSWGNVKCIYLLDAATGGNILWGGDLATAKDIASGDTPAIQGGLLTWKES
jgi:hypothetical protein